MAHELHFTDGKADFFEVGQIRSAWHELGTLLPTAPTLDQAIEIAHLGYTVEKTRTFREVVTPDGPVYLPSKAYITRRTDTGAELGIVCDQYKPVQNRDAFRAIEPLLDAGVLQLETGGCIRDGADAWLLGRFDLTKFGPICREVFADEIVPYALLANNHSGRRGVLVQLTPIRVVCANTLGVAESRTGDQSITIAHTGDANGKVIEAAQKLFAGIIERHETVAAHYRLLKQTVLSADEFDTLVLDPIAPDPRKHPRWNAEGRMANAVIERAERKWQVVTRLWMSGKGHTGDHSAWEAYNGAVEALDHDTDLFPARSGVYRTASLLGGWLAETKGTVLKGLLAHAESVAASNN